MTPVSLNLAVEDPLSEAVLRKIVTVSGRNYHIAQSYGKTGYGYLKKNIRAFNQAARIVPFLVLTDLDQYECPAILIQDWLSVPKHPNLLLRVAVKEVEAWLLADRHGFAKFAGVSDSTIPRDSEALNDPKRSLLRLMRKSRKRAIRDDILPKPDSTATQGRNYNGRLISFVNDFWDIRSARKRSASLNDIISRIKNFQPISA